MYYSDNLKDSITIGPNSKVKDLLVNEKSQKKMFFPHIFMNSEEFKDLGTLHFERREANYIGTD